jgi:hypothetical protein
VKLFFPFAFAAESAGRLRSEGASLPQRRTQSARHTLRLGRKSCLPLGTKALCAGKPCRAGDFAERADWPAFLEFVLVDQRAHHQDECFHSAEPQAQDLHLRRAIATQQPAGLHRSNALAPYLSFHCELHSRHPTLANGRCYSPSCARARLRKRSEEHADQQLIQAGFPREKLV